MRFGPAAIDYGRSNNVFGGFGDAAGGNGVAVVVPSAALRTGYRVVNFGDDALGEKFNDACGALDCAGAHL